MPLSRDPTRVAAGEVVVASGCGRSLPDPAGGAGRPLRLEEVAQVVLGLAQRDPRHDRLEEAEHDELARLVRRDAAALEIEELRLVDRTDRAGVRGPSTIRLVDLERGIATDRASRDRFIPNSPRKLSVPTALFSIVIRPFM